MGGSQLLQSPLDAAKVAVEQGTEQAAGRLANLPVGIVGKSLGRSQDALGILGVPACQQQTRDLAGGGGGRSGERLDPTDGPPLLRGERCGQALPDLVPQRGGTSGAAVVQLAVESGDHAARVIPRQGGQDGGQRAFLDRADVIDPGCWTHVRKISMWCWCKTAPPL